MVLTQGFWLADTACTQGLWRAVMGNNPSHFTGDDNLPVESVSWDDSMEFIARINGMIPGLDLRLPTEAQWEYACRAGTTTPFSFGTQITTDQVNYDGNYPYHGGRRGSTGKGRWPSSPCPLITGGSMRCTATCMEWCADWLGDYEAGTVTDPQGPATGVYRVLRGGSWRLRRPRCALGPPRRRCSGLIATAVSACVFPEVNKARGRAQGRTGAAERAGQLPVPGRKILGL